MYLIFVKGKLKKTVSLPCNELNHRNTQYRDIYSGHSPLPGGGGFLSKLKNRVKFERGLHEKGGEKKKKKIVIKRTLKYLYEA